VSFGGLVRFVGGESVYAVCSRLGYLYIAMVISYIKFKLFVGREWKVGWGDDYVLLTLLMVLDFFNSCFFFPLFCCVDL